MSDAHTPILTRPVIAPLEEGCGAGICVTLCLPTWYAPNGTTTAAGEPCSRSCLLHARWPASYGNKSFGNRSERTGAANARHRTVSLQIGAGASDAD